MIFSVWKPDGGYDYYESSVRHGIGDDLPEAELPPAVKTLGVPAQDAGRTLPPGSRFVGSGPVPRGVIAPMDRGQVRGMGETTTTSKPGAAWAMPGVLGIIVIAILYDFARESRKKR